MSRFPDLETRLYAWVMENRIKGVCIGGLAIQQEGRKLHQVYLNKIR